MSLVLSVEKLEIELTGTETSDTATLSKGQVAANCVPFVTHSTTRNSAERFDYRSIRVTISGTTVTAIRAAASSSTTVSIIIYVVEFNPAVSTVQTGSSTSSANSWTDAPGTNFSDLSKTFLVFGYTVTHTSDDFNDSQIRGEISSVSQITFARQTSANSATIQWYSVECDNDEFSVQRGNFSITGTSNSANSAAFTAVDTSLTMVVASLFTAEASDDAEEGSAAVDLVDSTHVRARRANGASAAGGATITIYYQVIEFSSKVCNGVDRGDFTISGLQATDPITTVDLDLSMAKGIVPQHSVSMNSTNGDDIGQINARIDLEIATTVRGRVTTNSTTGLWTWEVVEFKEAVISINQAVIIA